MTAPDSSRVHAVEAARKGGFAFDGRVRAAFVLFGGMVALQSSPDLDATKTAYLAGIVACLAAALVVVWTARRTREIKLQAAWIAASAAVVALCALSFLVAMVSGTAIADWVRDIAAYALFAAIPIFALDGQRSSSRTLLVGMLLIAGLLGGVAWAIEWLGRREILELPFERLVFPSGQLPGMLYVFAMATALNAGRRAAAWAMLAGVILGLFLLTGTRSSLLLLVAPLVMAPVAGRARLRSSVSSLAVHGIVAIALVLSFQLALALPVFLGVGRTGEDGSSVPAATMGPNVLGDRFGSLPGLVDNPASDPSIHERIAQYEAAWALFVASPIVGVGPGHSIDWTDVSGYPRYGFTADTPLVMPAKFGLLGIVAFLGAAMAYGYTVRNSLRRDRRSVITLALIGYGAWTIVGLPLGFPVEDKGSSLALMLLLALAFREEVALESVSGYQRQ